MLFESDPLIQSPADVRERPGFIVEARTDTLEDVLLLACGYGGSRSETCAITRADDDGFLLWRDGRTTVPFDAGEEAISI